MGDYLRFRSMLLDAYRTALGLALPPRPQVARHWESASALTWLVLAPGDDAFHLALSFGRLKGAPPPQKGHDTTGIFRLVPKVFPGVNDVELMRALSTLVPASADGATRAFLQRVAAQLGAAEVAVAFERNRGHVPFPTASDFAVHVPRRTDALYESAQTPRMPAHAEQRVRSALDAADDLLRVRVLSLFTAPQDELLDAVRSLDTA